LKIPNSFTQVIADTFYDKILTLYTVEEIVDEEGWAKLEETATTTTFSGNVRFDNLAQLQEDYGIKDVIDIAVTTNDNVEVGSVVKYDNVLYKISKAIPFDSHKLLIGNIWSSKSSDSISA
jgi:hypothetical protein